MLLVMFSRGLFNLFAVNRNSTQGAGKSYAMGLFPLRSYVVVDQDEIQSAYATKFNSPTLCRN